MDQQDADADRAALQRNREQRTTPNSGAIGVDTSQRRTGITPGSGSRTARILAVACVVVVPVQQPADPLVIS